MLYRYEVQQKQARNTAVAEDVSADAVDTIEVVDYRTGRATGPKRSVVEDQVYLADLESSTEEGRDDRTMPR